MQLDNKLVSVILPCYNAMPFLPEALESILNQTYTNLEIICINDGSTDATGKVLEEYAEKDKRIRVIHNEVNLKLISTLNKGIQLAKGEYIARMDADDIALPERVEKQLICCLTKKRDLVGSNIIPISQNGRKISDNTRVLISQHEIEFGSYFFTPFIHPTVFGKTALFSEALYSTEIRALHTEDYELWTRICSSNNKFCNLDESLLKLRINQQSVSRKHEKKQIENFIICANRHQCYFLDRDIPIEETSVAVNRFDNVPYKLAQKGVWLVNEITRKYLSSTNLNKKKARDVKTISDMQKADIAIQLIKKGKAFSKFFGAYLSLVIISKNLFNPKFKKYLFSKC